MRTLLVLEDESAVMRLLRCMLKQYNLIEAASEEEALQFFAGHGRQIDLLVADLTLPKSSGIQVALVLRSQIPNLPVILTSGYSVKDWCEQDSDDLERLGSTSVAILQKPFGAEELLKAVRDLLAAPQAEALGAGG